MLTLIAFKPEKIFDNRGEICCLPSQIYRRDNLTEEQLVELVDKLKIPEIRTYQYGEEMDCPYDEFHIFPSVGSSFLEEITLYDLQEIVNARKQFEKEQLESNLEPCDTCGLKPVQSNGICH
jgi:hypothetical protein